MASSCPVTPSRSRAELPDIYLILLDGFTRPDVLEDYFAVDSRELFEPFLQDGFYFAEQSSANYPRTLLATAATLNLSYLEPLVDELPPTVRASDDVRPLYWATRNSRLSRFLHDLGYETVAFGTGYDGADLRDADHYFTSPGSFTAFENMLVETTPLPVLLPLLHLRTSAERHRQRIRFVLRELIELASSPHDRPRFVYAHLLSPHPPYVFRSDGSAVESDRPADLDNPASHEVTGYAEQAVFIAQEIHRVTRIIRNRSAQPPMILLQSDHGSGLLPPAAGSVGSAEADERSWHESRYANLMAFDVPPSVRSRLYPTITPVNAFRVVLDGFFGTELGLLPDRNYWVHSKRPYEIKDVTDLVGGLLREPN